VAVFYTEKLRNLSQFCCRSQILHKPLSRVSTVTHSRTPLSATTPTTLHTKNIAAVRFLFNRLES